MAPHAQSARLGGAPARLLCLLGARLAALGSSALGAPPLPRVRELAASKAADSAASDHAGGAVACSTSPVAPATPSPCSTTATCTPSSSSSGSSGGSGGSSSSTLSRCIHACIHTVQVRVGVERQATVRYLVITPPGTRGGGTPSYSALPGYHPSRYAWGWNAKLQCGVPTPDGGGDNVSRPTLVGGLLGRGVHGTA